MKWIRVAIAGFLVLAGVRSQAGDAPSASRQKAEQDNKEIVGKVQTSMALHDIPALSLAIVRSGNVSLSKGFGVKRRGAKEEVGAESIYQIGSLTKMLTGIIANRLMNEGSLEMDSSVLSYFPTTLSDQAREALRNVTVKDLLHHRSGIPGWALNNGRIDGDPMLGGYSEKQFLEGLEAIQLKFDPGEGLAYSNSGYAVLGYICERVSGLSYDMLLEQYVATEFGLEDTVVFLDEAQGRRMAIPYRKDNRFVETHAWEMGKLAPAGGVFSNIDDLARLMEQQMCAYRNHSAPEENSLLVLTDRTDAFYGERTFYGFGMVKKVSEAGTSYFHGGDLDGFASEYRFMPEKNTGVVLLTTSGGKWFQDLGLEVFDLLVEQEAQSD